jgi:hypothetical protein
MMDNDDSVKADEPYYTVTDNLLNCAVSTAEGGEGQIRGKMILSCVTVSTSVTVVAYLKVKKAHIN